MAHIIAISKNEGGKKALYFTFKRDNHDLLIAQPAGSVYILQNTGLALMLARKCKIQHPRGVDVFIAEEMDNYHTPEIIRRASEWKAENGKANYPVKEETLKEHGLPSKEYLQEIRIRLDISINWPEKE